MSGLTECTPILDHYAKQRYLASLVTDSKHQQLNIDQAVDK